MTRPTRKDRADAILVCAMEAATDLHRLQHEGVFVHDDDVCASLGVTQAAADLAMMAWEAVAEALEWPDDITEPWLDAEAECLLRDGWSPDDPVARLREGRAASEEG